MSEAEFTIEEEREIGLRLPNGTEVFAPNIWHEHDPTTPEGRAAIVEALTNSAASLGMSASDLAGQYEWIIRINRRYITTVLGETENYPINRFPILESPVEQNDEAPSDLVSEPHE